MNREIREDFGPIFVLLIILFEENVRRNYFLGFAGSKVTKKRKKIDIYEI